MKKVAMIIVFIGGVLMTFQYFLRSSFLDICYKTILDWTMIISVFALVIAIYTLIKRQVLSIKDKTENIVYPLTTIISFFAVIILGFIFGIRERTPVDLIYQKFIVPLQATIFSLLAFYISSAAYRAFRAKNVSSTILLISASIVIIGRIPLGDMFSHINFQIFGIIIRPLYISALSEWILNVPNVAVQRALLFGITLGIISTSLKIILGIEKNWLK